MRMSYVLMAIVSTLSVYQVTVTASVGSEIALTGVMSLGFSHLAAAVKGVGDQSRFLRSNNIPAGDKEERGFAEGVQQLMIKLLVNKMARTNSFSDLEKVDDLAKLDKVSAAADNHLVSLFKFVDQEKNMGPRDLAKELKTFTNVDETLKKEAVQMYTNYLRGLGKAE
ncbi:RxLR effector protein [Phytophthora megakarya]|uniref:RxLR effector protein n=1 Tax=Phytophthora megakarya TaxID=4795 RepID=A0A225UW58_9STRA|nr:RxLR effector protein [Phytophthora megakarya]